MAEVTDSRVQFFNSESSFGSSSSISGSRIDFEFDQLMMSSSNIFDALKQTLRPRSDLTSGEELDHIVYRAKLLNKEAIPTHISRARNIRGQAAHVEQLGQCSSSLDRLIHDYQEYKRGKMSFQQFFAIYGNVGMDFSKKGVMESSANMKLRSRPSRPTENHVLAQPDVVNIVHYVQSSRDKVLNNQSRIPTPKHDREHNRRQIQKLQEEILLLRKELKCKEFQREEAVGELRKQSNSRIARIIKLQCEGMNNDQRIVSFRQELQTMDSYLKDLERRNENNVKKLQMLERENQKLRMENKNLVDEVESNRRMANSRMSQQEDENNKSAHSEYNGSGDDMVRKLQKAKNNLEYENRLLKAELSKERSAQYVAKKRLDSQKEGELARLRKAMEEKSRELSDVLHELDRLKIENIRLVDRLQRAEKSAELVKLTASKALPARESQNSQYMKSNGFKDSNRMEDSRLSKDSKPVIQNYMGDGNEQYPYYEFMNKEFRTRLRRACLKDKELLYKANGLEIGVITQFVRPNEFKICLYLSNFCDQQKISNLVAKVSNSKTNETMLQTSQYEVLGVGQQVKNYVTCTIRNYPLGCTVLFCEYDYFGKHEEIRVLLPIHIWKTLSFRPRDSEFDTRNVVSDSFAVDRKIAKDFETLAGYFGGARVVGNRIESTIHHEHTNTILLYDAEYRNGSVATRMEHKVGEPNVSEYIMKALAFVLRKEQGV